jgi:hypothetical protein
MEVFLAAPLEVLRWSPFHVFSRTANACSILLRFAIREKAKGSDLAPLRALHYYESLLNCLRPLLSKGGPNRTVQFFFGLIEGMRAYYCSNVEAPPPPPETEEQQHEEDAVAAASILCGGPSSSFPPPPPPPPPQPPQFQTQGQGYAMPTPPDQQQQQQQMFPPPPPPVLQQGIGMGYDTNMGGMESYGLNQQDFGAFLTSLDGQIMMGGGGLGFEEGAGGGGAGWPGQWQWGGEAQVMAGEGYAGWPS